MQNHNLLSKILGIVLCFLLSNCATTNAPSDWLSDPEQVASDPFGGWIDVWSREGRVTGELIAVTEDTMFAAGPGLHAVALNDILSARLVIYDASSLGGFVLLGTLSTFSNGWFLILTAPLWLIGGSIAASRRSYDPIIDYPDKPLKQFAPFARYPQGLPSGLDRGRIRMKVTSAKY